MASPDTLNFARLLAPLPGPNPTGVDLRADLSPGSVYYALRDARFAKLLAETAWGAAPDWRPILRQGVAVLTVQAKDLEIVSYVIEALARLYGFAGLRDGFRLARELIVRYG